MPDADAFEDALDELLRRIWARPREIFGEPPPELLRRLMELRLVYADWREEQGDLTAAAQRWLAREGKFPRYSGDSQDTWTWWNHGDRPDCKPEDLPLVIWQRLPGNPAGIPPNYKEYDSRAAAELALYKALLLLDRLDA
jgi:hypothetical protein